MSTSLLYHAFGLRGYDYVNTDYHNGGVIFTLGQRPHTYRCLLCNSRDVYPHGHQERTFKAVPIGHKPVTVVLPIPPRGMHGLRHCPAGACSLRRSPAELHPRFRALRPGVGPADDDSGCGPTLAGRLGSDQGHPKARSVPWVDRLFGSAKA
jgi:hypothetical protein